MHENPDADQSMMLQRLTDDNDGFEASFRREYPLIWLLTLVGPFLLTACLWALVYLAMGGEHAKRLAARAFFSFFVFGKFTILEPNSTLTSEELFLMVLYMDLMTAALLVFHTGFLFKLPFLGAKLADLVKDGQFILQSNPWMKRATFAGIVAFVMFPLATTGSIGGSIFGRLLGMSRLATFIGITLGSLLGCGLMYFGAGLIDEYLDKENPLLKIGGIVVVLFIILVMNHRYRKMKADHFARMERGSSTSKADVA